MSYFFRISVLFFLLTMAFCPVMQGQDLYTLPKNTENKWFSFENLSGAKGEGAQENQGAKGHAFDKVKAGAMVTLLDTEGSGTIQRIWMTVSDRSPEMLRSLRIEMFWDGAEKPAVSVPLGDFFGVGLGKRVAFENCLFSDPEGRSFNCIVPMPFKKGAKVTLSNDSDKDLGALFYDINMVKTDHATADMLYFHAFWNREAKTELAQDFEILPKITGNGRFLGTNVGILANPLYEKTWWGEGEVKMYLDGDGEHPTLVGTGAEDYIGTAYGQGVFAQQYQGSPIADKENGEFAFYRYHIPDPIFFYKDIRVTIQQIGGAPRDKVKGLVEKEVPLKLVTVDAQPEFVKLLEMKIPPKIQDPDFPEGWTNFYRQDDVSATAYFYLDKPTSDLPELQSVHVRTSNLDEKKD